VGSRGFVLLLGCGIVLFAVLLVAFRLPASGPGEGGGLEKLNAAQKQYDLLKVWVSHGFDENDFWLAFPQAGGRVGFGELKKEYGACDGAEWKNVVTGHVYKEGALEEIRLAVCY